MNVADLLRALQGIPLDTEVVMWDGYSEGGKSLAAVSVHRPTGISDPSQSNTDLSKPVAVLTRHQTFGYGIYPSDIYGYKVKP